MRTGREIEQEVGATCSKVWYNRCYLVIKEEIENGKHWIVEKWKPEFSTQNVTSKDIWESAKKSAEELEKKYGIENLGPYSDFDWGMMNGRLETLRWVLGDDWGNLDT